MNYVRTQVWLARSAACCFLGFLVLAGCGTQKQATKNSNVSEKKATDSVGLAIDLLRHSPELSQCKDALHLFQNHFEQSDFRKNLALTAEEAAFFKTKFPFNEEDLENLRSTPFRAADAHYLEECFLFRDIAQFLTPEEPNVVAPIFPAFHWVCRHVLLQEQEMTGLPPALILRRGFGGPWDRALVYLALLRQMNSDGGLVVTKSDPPKLVWVIATDPLWGNLRLLNPTTGQPVRTENGTSVATWNDVKKEPGKYASQAPSKVDLNELQVWLVAPQSSLTNRMRETQRILSLQEGINLHFDAKRAYDRVSSSIGVPVSFWTEQISPELPTPPLRAWTEMLAVEDGGTDKTDRWKRYKSDLVPWSSTLLTFMKIRLWQDLAEPARSILLSYAEELYRKFDVHPNEFILRGQVEKARNRLGRVRPLLDDETLSTLLTDAKFNTEVASFREKLNEAYHGMLQAKEPSQKNQIQSNITNFFNQDLYFMTLIQTDFEEDPNRFRDRKTVLTKILGLATREYLSQRSDWHSAMAWQEIAEKYDLVWASRPPEKKFGKNFSRPNWVLARGAWNIYVDRHELSEASVQQRLEPIRQLVKTNFLPVALDLLERLHLDHHQYLEGKFQLAHAQRQLDPAIGRKILEQLLAEVERLRKSSPLKQELSQWAERGGNNDPFHLRRRTEFMQRTWADDGYLAAFQNRVETELKRKAKG